MFYNIWEQQKDQDMRYKVPGPEYPEEYPEYPGKSGISGFKLGASGFLWLQNLKSSFESLCDSTCNRENRITS